MSAARPARVAVYPGSFDPIHNGHLDLIERCRPMFDEVVIAVLHNDEKRPLFSVEERMAMIREIVDGDRFFRVESFSGLLVQFMDRIGAQTIVRGLRAVSDFEYEFQMALMNRHLNGRVDTVFMTPREEYSYLSSRLLRQVASYGADLHGLAPPSVLARLARKLGRSGEEEARGREYR